MNLERYARWRFNDDDAMQFDTLDTGLAALRLEASKNPSLCLVNPLSPYEYRVIDGSIEKHEPFTTYYDWVFKTVAVWSIFFICALFVGGIIAFNTEWGHWAVIIVGSILLLMSLVFFIFDLEDEAIGFKEQMLNVIPLAVALSLVSVEYTYPEMLLAPYTQSETHTVREFQQTSNPNLTLIVTDKGRFLVRDGLFIRDQKLTVNAAYFDQKMNKPAKLELCNQADDCVSAQLMP